jgi:cell division control protein 24
MWNNGDVRRRPRRSTSDILSPSSPVYYFCTSLRSRLLSIPDFSHFFELVSPNEVSVNPVTQLWDIFCLGTSLCFIYNLLPSPYPHIDIDTGAQKTDEHTAKFAIARFAVHIKQTFRACDPFTFYELLNRNSTDGLVKVGYARSLVIIHA